MKKFFLFFLSAGLLFSACKMNEDPVVTTIVIQTMPEKVSYFKGEKLSLTGLELSEVYSDGKFGDVESFETDPEEGTVLTKTGKQKIVISSGNKKTYYHVTVQEPKIIAFTILSMPNKLIYANGEKLNLDGMILKAEYDNGIVRHLTQDEVEVSPSLKSVLKRKGNQEIKIKYLGHSVSFTVEIQEEIPEYSETPVIIKQPASGKYLTNENAELKVNVKQPIDGELHYQWFESDNRNEQFTIMDEYDTPVMQISNNGQESEHYYYVIVKNHCEGKITTFVQSDVIKVQFTDAVKILSQTKEAVFDLYSDYQLPTLSVQYKVNTTGTIKTEWYKKSQNKDPDILLFKELNQTSLSDEGIFFSSSFTIPKNDFGEHEVNTHYYYCKTEVETENSSFSTNSELIPITVRLPETGLKTLVIQTEDGEDPTGRYLKTLGLTTHSAVADKVKLPGTLKIFQNSECIYDSGNYNKDSSGITIKLRGNGSAYTDKKPFKITLQQEDNLLFNNNDKQISKDWCLLADGYTNQKKTFFVLAGFMTSELCGFDWVPKFEYVNLILNNSYRGVYLLCESVDQDEKKITTNNDGFLIEKDFYVSVEAEFNEIITPPLYFLTDPARKLSSSYSFKYPSDKKITENQIDYIKNYVIDFEKSLATGEYEKYIDSNSWSAWFLVHDIIGMADTWGTNKFIRKFDSIDNSVLEMCTPWDFSSASTFKNPNKWPELHTDSSAFYGKQLFTSENRTFVENYKEKWTSVSPTLYEKSCSYLDSFETAFGVPLNNSLILDGYRWNRTNISVEENIEFIKSWFNERTKWINDNIDSL